MKPCTVSGDLNHVRLQSRTQSPQAFWSAGGAKRDSGVMAKNVIFLIGCSGLFAVTKLRTVKNWTSFCKYEGTLTNSSANINS